MGMAAADLEGGYDGNRIRRAEVQSMVAAMAAWHVHLKPFQYVSKMVEATMNHNLQRLARDNPVDKENGVAAEKVPELEADGDDDDATVWFGMTISAHVLASKAEHICRQCGVRGRNLTSFAMHNTAVDPFTLSRYIENIKRHAHVLSWVGSRQSGPKNINMGGRRSKKQEHVGKLKFILAGSRIPLVDGNMEHCDVNDAVTRHHSGTVPQIQGCARHRL